MMRIGEIERMIKLYRNYYDKVSAGLKELEKKVPDGARLHAAKHGELYQYYIRWNGNKSGRDYIGKEKREQAKLLAQVEYYEKLSKKLQNDMKCLDKLKETWSGDPFNWVEENMSQGKFALVTPVYPSDTRFIHEWKNQAYEKMSFTENSPEYYTMVLCQDLVQIKMGDFSS